MNHRARPRGLLRSCPMVFGLLAFVTTGPFSCGGPLPRQRHPLRHPLRHPHLPRGRKSLTTGLRRPRHPSHRVPMAGTRNQIRRQRPTERTTRTTKEFLSVTDVLRQNCYRCLETSQQYISRRCVPCPPFAHKCGQTSQIIHRSTHRKPLNYRGSPDIRTETGAPVLG